MPPEEDDTTTTNTKTRWEHTGTIATMMLVGTICGVVLSYVYHGEEVPLWAATTFGLAMLSSVAWLYGEKALRAATESKGGK